MDNSDKVQQVVQHHQPRNMRTLSLCMSALSVKFDMWKASAEHHSSRDYSCGRTDASVHSALTVCQYSMLGNAFHMLLTADHGNIESYVS